MYKDIIRDLVAKSPLDIDTEITLSGQPPTMASSEFLTNKEQGDWAEIVVHKAINEYIADYFAVKYGESGSLASGDEGFKDFYLKYQEELNTIGKKPDLLIFKVSDFPDKKVDIKVDADIKKAIAAIEVRSSSFLSEKYAAFMLNRQKISIIRCEEIRRAITARRLGPLLERKNKTIYDLIFNATEETFQNVDFRCPSWSLTEDLAALSDLLKELKDNVKILHKRDYLSITPKMEDIALVNRWIQKYNVRHFYLQVFFDKAYVVSFQDILALCSNDENEGPNFSIERDIKNQGKTTIKVNVQVGKELIGKMDMPEHQSRMKELDRGRLLFYVTFLGGKGYLDKSVFTREIINA